MVYGVVKNGVILLESEAGLRDGTRVRVEPVDGADNSAPRGSAKAILDGLRTWSGQVSELEGLEREVQRMRNVDRVRWAL